MTKNVLLANALYLPNVGGVENYLRSLAATLTSAGYAVDIVCSDHVVSGTTAADKSEIRDEARVSRYRYGRGVLGYIRQLRDARRLARRRNTEVGGFDYVVARSHHAVIFCRLAVIREVTYVVPAIYSIQYAHRLQSRSIKSWVGYFGNIAFQRVALAVSKDVVVLSEEMRRQVRRFSRGSISPRLIPPGVDTGRFCPRSADERSRFRRELGIPEGGRIVLALGRFAPVKGFEFALKALPYLPEDCFLLLVGEGPLREKYQECVDTMGLGKRVYILPSTQRPEELYGVADVFVFPSLHEPFGQVLLEATASGLPVAAFAPGAGVSTATAEIYGGYDRLAALSPAPSPRGLAASVLKAFEYAQHDKDAFERERAYFLSQYAWANVAHQLMHGGS